MPAIFCLTKLRSLKLIRESGIEPIVSAYQISQLAQLTRLDITGLDVGSSIFSLTNLVELDIFGPLPWNGWTDGALPKLEKLIFACQFCPVLASNVLSKLENLSQVWIYSFRNETNGSIFETLAALTQLTDLNLHFSSGEDMRQLQQVTLLTNLLCLELSYDLQLCPCDYILEGILPRVRYLNLDISEFSEETCRELKRRLHMSRKIRLRQVRSRRGGTVTSNPPRIIEL